jgi:hypothetical protein
MIHFHDSKGNLIASGKIGDNFDIVLGPSVSSVAVDGPELVEAWQILGRSGIPSRESYTFVDVHAEELYVNWTKVPA